MRLCMANLPSTSLPYLPGGESTVVLLDRSLTKSEEMLSSRFGLFETSFL